MFWPKELRVLFTKISGVMASASGLLLVIFVIILPGVQHNTSIFEPSSSERVMEKYLVRVFRDEYVIINFWGARAVKLDTFMMADFASRVFRSGINRDENIIPWNVFTLNILVILEL